MNTLVLYDSNYGNTEIIAKTIAHVLDTKAQLITQVANIKPDEYDLIVVGSPINGWSPTKKIDDYLRELKPNSLHGVKAAGFDTRIKIFFHGNAAKKITNNLKKAGAEIIAEPMGFYVQGTEGPLMRDEMENAINWAQEIKERYGRAKLSNNLS